MTVGIFIRLIVLAVFYKWYVEIITRNNKGLEALAGEEFAKANQTPKIAIVMDGAGWHKSDKLILPKNIRIIIQPPYYRS